MLTAKEYGGMKAHGDTTRRSAQGRSENSDLLSEETLGLSPVVSRDFHAPNDLSHFYRGRNRRVNVQPFQHIPLACRHLAWVVPANRILGVVKAIKKPQGTMEST